MVRRCNPPRFGRRMLVAVQRRIIYMQIRSVGIDLGKTTFHLVALGAAGKALIRKKFTQKQLLTYTANMQTSLIGLEACSGTRRLPITQSGPSSSALGALHPVSPPARRPHTAARHRQMSIETYKFLPPFLQSQFSRMFRLSSFLNRRCSHTSSYSSLRTAKEGQNAPCV